MIIPGERIDLAPGRYNVLRSVDWVNRTATYECILDGSPLAFHFWATGIPSNIDREGCESMLERLAEWSYKRSSGKNKVSKRQIQRLNVQWGACKHFAHS
jgi:hypothetical protein